MSKDSILRESNFDLLRFLAMLGIIINHVSDVFLYTPNQSSHPIVTYTYEGFGAFAVPAFMMLTGAFQITGQRQNIYHFYTKYFKKLGLQLIIFNFIYTLEIIYAYRTYNISDTISYIMTFQRSGFLFHPLWYLYTLLGIYIFIPLLNLLKYYYGTTIRYHIFSILFCIWAFLSISKNSPSYSYSLFSIIGYMGYVILGNELKCLVKRTNCIYGVILLLIGFSIYIGNYIIYYLPIENKMSVRKLISKNYISPLLIIASCIIFIGICMIKIKFQFKLTAKYSLYIYLIHRGVLDILNSIFMNTPIINDCRIYIPVVVSLTLVVSLFLSVIYRKFLATLRLI